MPRRAASRARRMSSISSRNARARAAAIAESRPSIFFRVASSRSASPIGASSGVATTSAGIFDAGCAHGGIFAASGAAHGATSFVCAKTASGKMPSAKTALRMRAILMAGVLLRSPQVRLDALKGRTTRVGPSNREAKRDFGNRTATRVLALACWRDRSDSDEKSVALDEQQLRFLDRARE